MEGLQNYLNLHRRSALSNKKNQENAEQYECKTFIQEEIGKNSIIGNKCRVRSHHLLMRNIQTSKRSGVTTMVVIYVSIKPTRYIAHKKVHT